MRAEHIGEMYFNSLRFSILYFSQLKNVIAIIIYFNLFYAILAMPVCLLINNYCLLIVLLI